MSGSSGSGNKTSDLAKVQTFEKELGKYIKDLVHEEEDVRQGWQKGTVPRSYEQAIDLVKNDLRVIWVKLTWIYQNFARDKPETHEFYNQLTDLVTAARMMVAEKDEIARPMGVEEVINSE